MKSPAWIGLGSNLGDRRAILDAAVAALADSPGVSVRAVSAYHETAPVGGPPGQGPFLNAAAHLETTLDPQELLSVLQGIEAKAGRVRVVRWGERTLDLDLLIFGTKYLETSVLKLPHPRLAIRRFVLAPLAEIAPDVVDSTTGRTVADLLANLDRRPRLLAIEGPKGEAKLSIFRRLVDELPGFGISGSDLGSPTDPESSPIDRSFAALEGKARALKASLWAVETLRVPWIVADYCLDLELPGETSASLLFAGWPAADRPRLIEAYNSGMPRVRDAASEALPTTLALVLLGGRWGRFPGVSPVPVLRPDSSDPDAIVAEALATCRSIAGV